MEDVVTGGLLALAIANPIAAALVAAGLVVLSIWLVVAARRAIRGFLGKGGTATTDQDRDAADRALSGTTAIYESTTVSRSVSGTAPPLTKASSKVRKSNATPSFLRLFPHPAGSPDARPCNRRHVPPGAIAVDLGPSTTLGRRHWWS